MLQSHAQTYDIYKCVYISNTNAHTDTCTFLFTPGRVRAVHEPHGLLVIAELDPCGAEVNTGSTAQTNAGNCG